MEAAGSRGLFGSAAECGELGGEPVFAVRWVVGREGRGGWGNALSLLNSVPSQGGRPGRPLSCVGLRSGQREGQAAAVRSELVRHVKIRGDSRKFNATESLKQSSVVQLSALLCPDADSCCSPVPSWASESWRETHPVRRGQES